MEFRILGPLEVVDDGRKLALGGVKQRSLLALLLLQPNRVVPRDRLIDELWDTAPPETARTALQVHVSGLRKTLGRERILTQAPGYLVRIEPGELDLDRFEQLLGGGDRGDSAGAAEAMREALALWRGPPLGDLDDSFARAERARLEEQRLLALEQRIDADLALGLHAELVPELEGLVRENPLRERLRAQLMLALYRCGRQADALDVYRQGRQLLAEELGLEPGEELRRLEQAILRQDESLAAPARAAAKVPGVLGGKRGGLRLFAIAAGALLLIAAAITGIVLGTRSSAAIVVAANSVAALDAKTGKVVADVPIGGRPVAIAVGAGAVWVADGDHSTVSRIDAKTKERLPIGGLGSDVSDLAFGFGSLWVAGGNDGTLVRVDPRHNGIEPLALGRAGDGVPEPVFSVRVAQTAPAPTRGNQVLRVDPRINEVTARRPVARPHGIAAGLGSLWVTTEDERIVRIDSRTAETVYARDVSHLTYFPVVAHGSLWVIAAPTLSSNVPEVWRLDPGTLSQQAQLALPRRFPYQLTAGNGALWTVDPSSGAVWRIDERTTSAKRLTKLRHHPVAVAASGGVVWVGVQAEPLG